ncbi:hypothetical protein [Bacillus sp. EAC]|uniref:hypothetical protein n=1 Tax=Bacillus sp. EAC TaxID=1978338 RepID=UPI000B44EB2B|nr:hypothetical protein [Bacillus sp. EAC]
MKKLSKRNVLMTSLSAALVATAVSPAVISAATVKLSVKKVTVVNTKTVLVEFNKAVNKTSASKASNYVFAKGSGVTVTKVTLSGNKAILTVKGADIKTASFKAGLTVSNVKDNKGKVMSKYKTNVAFTIAVKSVAFTKVQTLDTDKNGKLDSIAVTFSRAVTEVDKADFAVAGYTVTNASTRGVVTTLTLEEKDTNDLSAKPAVSFVGEVKSSGKSVKSIKSVATTTGFIVVNLGGENFAFTAEQNFFVNAKLPETFTRPAGSQLRFKVLITKDGVPVKNLTFVYLGGINSTTNAQGVAYVPEKEEVSDLSLTLLKMPEGYKVPFTITLPSAGNYEIKAELVDHNANDTPVQGAEYKYLLK